MKKVIALFFLLVLCQPLAFAQLMGIGPDDSFDGYDVAPAEVNELWTLYNNGGGSSWTDHTNWFQDKTTSGWYGLTVSGGHVTQIDLHSNNGNGNISDFDASTFSSLTYLSLHSNSFSGDLSGWSLPSSLAYLYLSSNSFSGDLSGWSLLSSLARLYLHSNSFTGDLSGWSLPSSLTYLYLSFNSFSGDLSGWSLPSSLAYLSLHSNSFSGDLSGWSLPSSLAYLYLYSNSFSGDLSGWSLPSSLATLRLYSNSFSGDPDISGNTAMQDYRYEDNALSQADVDAVVEGIYDNWADFTYATPALNIGGTNSTPSGTYQDGDPPTTGKEFIYEIVNDPESTGNEVWAVTYTGAP